MRRVSIFAVWIVLFVLLAICTSADVLSGTMVRTSNADPNLFFHEGKYYLTQTGTSRIAVFEADTVEGLNKLSITDNIAYTAYLDGKIYDAAVVELYGAEASINGTWSPEIHYFSEEQFPGKSGFYMFLGLRKNTGDSSMVRMVVLKSLTDSPKGPYGHPVSGKINHSQPVLNADGSIYDEWGCGQTVLEIPEGNYKGTYTMWVSEEGRGGSGLAGTFYQKIMIGKMKSPWQLDSEVGVVTTPTQKWEYAGADKVRPRVVEGATAVYGRNGEVFIVYSGSGYWSTYGLGQLTWTGENPLETSSWVKLLTPDNPIFTAVGSDNLRGAGHASFLTDTSGRGFFCYHAYPFENDKKASARNSYIEPYYIDYTAWNGYSFGVIRLGLDDTGKAANTGSKIVFETSGKYLSPPSLRARGGSDVTLKLNGQDAEGYIIYRSEDQRIFDYLATTASDTYKDTGVKDGKTYYYRVYSYRKEEISTASEIKSATVSPPPITGDVNGDGVVSIYDVLLVLKYTVYGEGKQALVSADVDKSGGVTKSDAEQILKSLIW